MSWPKANPQSVYGIDTFATKARHEAELDNRIAIYRLSAFAIVAFVAIMAVATYFLY